MATLWGGLLAEKYADVIGELETAVSGCPAELWEASLWEVKKSHRFVWPVRRVDDPEPGDTASQEALLQTFSAFWNIAYHSAFHIDFYLAGAPADGFVPLPPFREDENRANVVPNRVYTRDEITAYLAYDRERIRATLGGLTDEAAARVVPRNGKPFADLLLHGLLHAQEHAGQLNLFLGQR